MAAPLYAISVWPIRFRGQRHFIRSPSKPCHEHSMFESITHYIRTNMIHTNMIKLLNQGRKSEKIENAKPQTFRKDLICVIYICHSQ